MYCESGDLQALRNSTGGDAVDGDPFVPRVLAVHDADGAARHLDGCGEDTDECEAGGVVDRRSGEADHRRGVERARDGATAAGRDHADRRLDAAGAFDDQSADGITPARPSSAASTWRGLWRRILCSRSRRSWARTYWSVLPSGWSAA